MDPSKSNGGKDLKELQLENIELHVQLNSYKEIIEKMKNWSLEEEKKLNGKLEILWSNSINFLEKSKTFHDEFGLSSSWWKSQIEQLNNQDIQHKKNLRKANEKEFKLYETEFEMLNACVTGQQQEIEQIQKKIAADDAMIVELNRAEEILQQEPFGPEFMSLKSKLQRSKDTCLRLENTKKETNQFRKRAPEPITDEKSCDFIAKKIFCTKEKTTFVYKTSHGTRNKANDKFQSTYFKA